MTKSTGTNKPSGVVRVNFTLTPRANRVATLIAEHMRTKEEKHPTRSGAVELALLKEAKRRGIALDDAEERP